MEIISNVMGGVSIGGFKIQNNQLIFSENYHQNLIAAGYIRTHERIN